MVKLLYNEHQLAWQNNAECRDTDPRLFFPVGESGTAVQQINDAKSVCGKCAVRKACLAYAIDTQQFYGIWGGTSEEERRPMIRSRSKTSTSSAI